MLKYSILTTLRYTPEDGTLQCLLTRTPDGLPIYLFYVSHNVINLYGVLCERCVLKLSKAFQEALAGCLEQDAESSGSMDGRRFIDSLSDR
jgi:hypothetical protein